ncbi:MAG: hypothetical protein EOP09_17305 [Proteobacteria bacterium]|nr:MAG: hypothetical protein EOP09_17305 [Pseudomonadota bacterium]
MIILIPTRAAYKAFIRTLTAVIVFAVSRFKGALLKGIFDLRPFTRILSWGRDYRNVMAYHDLNDLEAFGYIGRPKKKSAKSKSCRRRKSAAS